jgi:hypothetical protein
MTMGYLAGRTIAGQDPEYNAVTAETAASLVGA